MNKKIGIYPGTFDPITNGHLELVKRALSIFDSIIIAVVRETSKKTLFTPEERTDLIIGAVSDLGPVSAEIFDGLLVKYAKTRGGCAIIRGLRAVSDFEYELQMALMNRRLDPEIETVFLMPSEEFSFISSTLVKEVASLGGSVEGLVPANVKNAIIRKFSK